MLCHDCGGAISAGLQLCPWCGARLGPPPDTAPAPLSAEEEAFVSPLFRFPPLTVAILALNLLIFLLETLLGGSEDQATLLFMGAKLRAAIVHGDLWRLLTAGFLHIGWPHILLNSLSLIQLGLLCENIYGRRRFLYLYLLTGMAGFLASTLFSASLSAGASASLFGLMGVLLAFGWRHALEIPPAFRRHFTWYLAPWVVAMIVFGLFYRRIDNSAHLGGLAMGLILGLTLRNRILAPPPFPKEERPFRIAFISLMAFSILSFGQAAHGAWRDLSASRHLFGPHNDQGQLEVLSRYLKRSPQAGLYHTLYAETALRLGLVDQAEAALRQALAARHEEASTRNALAWLLITERQPTRDQLDEAVTLSRAAIREERDPAFLNTHGWALFLRGDIQLGISQLEAAAQKHAGADRLIDLYMLALAYHHLQKPQQALESLRKAQALEQEEGLPPADSDLMPFRAKALEALDKGPAVSDPLPITAPLPSLAPSPDKPRPHQRP